MNKKEEVWSHAVSRQERHRLKKNAHDRILIWKQGTLDVSEIDETEDSSASSDSGTSGSESDTKTKKASKKKKQRATPRKKRTKATAAKKKEARTNANEVEEEVLIDTALIEQKMKLKRKIANQQHIAEVAES